MNSKRPEGAEEVEKLRFSIDTPTLWREPLRPSRREKGLVTMVERLWKFGCGVSLIFGGAAGYGAADALFQKVLAVMLFFGAVVFFVVMLVQAAAEDRAERPVAEDVRRVKIKEKPWVRKYYDGEFDPEDDPSQSPTAPAFSPPGSVSDKRLPPATIAPKGRACETASAASKIKKFVL